MDTASLVTHQATEFEEAHQIRWLTGQEGGRKLIEKPVWVGDVDGQSHAESLWATSHAPQ